MTNVTLRSLMGMASNPAGITTSALIMVDLQNTYTKGVMQLEGVEPAVLQAKALLERFR